MEHTKGMKMKRTSKFEVREPRVRGRRGWATGRAGLGLGVAGVALLAAGGILAGASCSDSASVATGGMAGGAHFGSGGGGDAGGSKGPGGQGGIVAAAGNGGGADGIAGAGGVAAVAGGGGTPQGGAGGPTPTVKVVPLSSSGHDRFYKVLFGKAGQIYAVGQVASGTDAATDYSTVVARFSSSGVLDAGFGAGGVTVKNFAVGAAGELARGLALQSTGKLIVAGAMEHAGASDARDRDLFVARLDGVTGLVDSTFGQNGVVTLDLSTGALVGSSFLADAHWGLAIDEADRILVSGSRLAANGANTELVTVRLLPDGAVDAAFGVQGTAAAALPGQNISARSNTLMPDGSILAAGYTNANGVTSPVLYKLDGKGVLDPSFAVGGIFNQPLWAVSTECYGAVAQASGKIVTGGYGKKISTQSTDWVSFRLTAAGTVDASYGPSGDGTSGLDAAGFNDNARSVMVLPDDRVVLSGGARPVADNVDGMVAVLDKDGIPDATFAAQGRLLVDLGGPNDFLWGGSLSPDGKNLVFAGIKGAGAAVSGGAGGAGAAGGAPGSGALAGNDDAALVFVPLGR